MNNQDFHDGLLKPYQEGLKKLKGKQELPEIVVDNYKAIIGKLEKNGKKRKKNDLD